MLFILHRINTISKLKKAPTSYGVEIDIRSYNSKLILSHDPFIKGEGFENWLKFYKHSFLIINIKEEGLEPEIIKILKRFKLKNYFFLDQSFPFIIKYANLLNKNSAIRFSDYECFETVLSSKRKVSWIWVDFFNNFPLNLKNINSLKNTKLKICLVSPELHKHRNPSDIKIIYKILKKINFIPDAICTKNPKIWEGIFKKIT